MTADVSAERPPRLTLRPAVVLASVHIGLRAILIATGARFQGQSLEYSWQLLDLKLLRHDPISSIWRLHTQPPLFNSIVALLVRSPLRRDLTFEIVGHALAVVLVVGVWRMVAAWTRSRVAATVAAIVVSIMPSVVVSEFQPTYEIWVMVGLVWLVVFADTRRLVAAGVLAGAVALTRAMFHPVWLIVVVGLLAAAMSARRRSPSSSPAPSTSTSTSTRNVVLAWLRRAALIGAVPFLATGFFLVKNAVLFDQTGLSSWLGMNLQRVAINPLTPAQHVAMTSTGRLSGYSGVREFGRLDMYERVAPCAPHSGHPALTEPEKDVDLSVVIPNFNDECYLPIYAAVGRDARRAIVEHPDAYARGVWASARLFVKATETDALLHSDLASAYDAAWAVVLIAPPVTIDETSWVFPIAGIKTFSVHVSLVALAALVTTFAVGAVAALRRRAVAGIPAGTAVLIAWTSLWCTASGILLESGENERFRAMIDPLLVAVAVSVAVSVIGRRRARGRTVAALPTPQGSASSYKSW